jgi:hypothetical protein
MCWKQGREYCWMFLSLLPSHAHLLWMLFVVTHGPQTVPYLSN